MRPRIKGAWLAAGIALLGAMIAGGEARAGSRGITIDPGGIKPGTGDPPYDYIFYVYLDPDFEIQASGSPLNFFQVGSTTTPLVGVGTDSLTHQPTSIPSVVWTPLPGTEEVSWTFLGNTSIPNTTSSNLFLGEFIVQTDKSYTSPPDKPGTIIDYTFTVFDLATHTTISGSNSFTLVSIPEPSSVVMLAAGAAAIAVMVIRGRRRAGRSA
jgi:hypothetical protein